MFSSGLVCTLRVERHYLRFWVSICTGMRNCATSYLRVAQRRKEGHTGSPVHSHPRQHRVAGVSVNQTRSTQCAVSLRLVWRGFCLSKVAPGDVWWELLDQDWESKQLATSKALPTPGLCSYLFLSVLGGRRFGKVSHLWESQKSPVRERNHYWIFSIQRFPNPDKTASALYECLLACIPSG